MQFLREMSVQSGIVESQQYASYSNKEEQPRVRVVTRRIAHLSLISFVDPGAQDLPRRAAKANVECNC